MRFRVYVAITLLAVLAPLPAAAGVIRGTLWVNAKAAALIKPRPGVAAAPTANGRPNVPEPDAVASRIAKAQRGVNETVVWLEKIPPNVEEKLTGGGGWFIFRKASKERVARIVQKNLRFIPRVQVVAFGSRIEFMNMDRVYHNVFSVSAAKRFDLGKYPPGRVDTVKFDRIGVINLHCDIHPDQSGFVVVTPNHAFVRPDSLGRFALPKLPSGRYTLRAWHPRHGELKRHVELPRRGDVSLELVF